MKKILLLVGTMLLLAAACNSTSQTNVNTPPTTSGAKIDATVNALGASIEAEESLETQSDNDIVNSDAEIINSYNGVSNASNY